MRIAIIALFLGLSTGLAFAQTTPPPTKESPNTTGRTVIPEKKKLNRSRPNRAARRLQVLKVRRRQGCSLLPKARRSRRNSDSRGGSFKA